MTEQFADTRIGWWLLRLYCRFGRHNLSCRGRHDHVRADGSVIT